MFIFDLSILVISVFLAIFAILAILADLSDPVLAILWYLQVSVPHLVIVPIVIAHYRVGVSTLCWEEQSTWTVSQL